MFFLKNKIFLLIGTVIKMFKITILKRSGTDRNREY